MRALKNVYLTPEGKASLESNEGKNTIVARQDNPIDDHTAAELDIAKLFEDDAKKRLEESQKSGSLIEQAKARQNAAKDAAKTELKTTPKSDAKTEPAKADGGSK